LKRKALVPIESEIDATVSLLENPNPIMGWEGFIDFFITNYLISGNGFSELSKNSLGQIYRMYPIQSYQLQTIVGTYPNFIKSYELLNYTRSSVPAGEMLHIKTYNPDPIAGYFVGMAPLKAGSLAVRQNNDGASWNISMMDNLGKIPGMFTSDDEMEPATKNTIKSEWDSKISGQPGKPLVLDGGAVKFTPFAMTMQDADFIESQKMTGEQIAMVYGLDPAAIGLGKTIYNNVREAKTAKFYSVIIPLADYFRSEFNRTVVANHNAVESELFKRPVKKYVDYDVESIEALQEDRKDVFARISAAKFLTYDEQRQEAGHDALNIEGKTNVPVGLIEKPTTEAVKPT
jgi:HK97 family phage portal protein